MSLLSACFFCTRRKSDISHHSVVCPSMKLPQQVLKWDLRPATVYDFVRAFCALLPSAPSTGAPVTLSSKEDKEDELEQLRVGAEEIADLSASGAYKPCVSSGAFLNFFKPGDMLSPARTVAVRPASFRAFYAFDCFLSKVLSQRACPRPLFLSFCFACLSCATPSHVTRAADVCFLDFSPSTVAISALLLSISRGTASSSPCDKFHEDVLDIACVEAVVGGSDSEAKGSVSLQRVLDCIQLLGSKLSERYPAVASAAAAAAARVARYGGLVDKEVMASVEVASAGGAPGIKQSGTITPLPAGVRPKGRRCSTPTGVEGIMHIEMAAIRDASSVGGEEKAGDGRDGAKGAAPVRNGGTGAGKCGNDEVKTDAGMKQARPSAFKQTRHGASAEAVGGGESGNISGGKRSRAGSFAFSDEDIAFARASKKTKGQATVSLQSSTTAVSVAAAADGKTTKTGAPRVVLGGASWQPFKSTTSAGRSPAGTAGATLSIAGDGGKSNRKRSAEVLGHCARGSGFGVPPPRLTQAARVSQHPSPVSEMSAPSMTATVPTTNTSIFTAPG